jgi:hypothetical protein
MGKDVNKLRYRQITAAIERLTADNDTTSVAEIVSMLKSKLDGTFVPTGSTTNLRTEVQNCGKEYIPSIRLQSINDRIDLERFITMYE